MRRNNKKSKQCYIFVLLYLVGLGLKHQCHHNITLGYLNFIFKNKYIATENIRKRNQFSYCFSFPLFIAIKPRLHWLFVTPAHWLLCFVIAYHQAEMFLKLELNIIPSISPICTIEIWPSDSAIFMIGYTMYWTNTN